VITTALRLRRIDFVEARYGVDKFCECRNTALYVLRSFTETFAVPVVDLLTAETRAIVSQSASWWPGLSEKGAR